MSRAGSVEATPDERSVGDFVGGRVQEPALEERRMRGIRVVALSVPAVFAALAAVGCRGDGLPPEPAARSPGSAWTSSPEASIAKVACALITFPPRTR